MYVEPTEEPASVICWNFTSLQGIGLRIFHRGSVVFSWARTAFDLTVRHFLALTQFVRQSIYVSGDRVGVAAKLVHASLQIGHGRFDVTLLFPNGVLQLTASGTDHALNKTKGEEKPF